MGVVVLIVGLLLARWTWVRRHGSPPMLLACCATVGVMLGLLVLIGSPVWVE